MRYERDNSGSIALGCIADRIRALPEYTAARELVISNAVRRIEEHGGASVEVLRQLGGLTWIVRQEIKALPAMYRADHGSKMYPRSVVDMLSEGELREALQSRLARARAHR